MIIEAPSEHAIELYHIAMRVIALAGIYQPLEIGYVLERLASEQSRYTRTENDWRSFESMKNAIQYAAMS